MANRIAPPRTDLNICFSINCTAPLDIRWSEEVAAKFADQLLLMRANLNATWARQSSHERRKGGLLGPPSRLPIIVVSPPVIPAMMVIVVIIKLETEKRRDSQTIARIAIAVIAVVVVIAGTAMTMPTQPLAPALAAVPGMHFLHQAFVQLRQRASRGQSA